MNKDNRRRIHADLQAWGAHERQALSMEGPGEYTGAEWQRLIKAGEGWADKTPPDLLYFDDDQITYTGETLNRVRESSTVKYLVLVYHYREGIKQPHKKLQNAQLAYFNAGG